ncbi:MAG: hypothetical protein QOD07_412 [Frankiaceae bacterium]|jgi:hypothetical protein|nr:hypothetical protein [Frankiaceae bacterium]
MARAPKDSPADSEGSGRLAQMRAVWGLTRKSDPRLPVIVLGAALVALALFVVIGIVVGHPIYFVILGLLAAVLTGTTIFGRRATTSMYAQVEGQPGAAASVLQTMRGEWRVTPAVAFNRNMDLVHRVVGRPGVVLVGEGNSPTQLRQLITDQKRRVARVAPDTPIFDFVVGDAEGQVPLRRLQRAMVKLPRNLSRKDIGAVEGRMRALGGTNVPLPKGPMPKSAKIPRGKMR